MSKLEHERLLGYQLAHRPLSLVILETGVFVAIALAAFVGNSCVLYVFYRSPRLRKVTSYYLITLAISDIILAMGLMPITIATSIQGENILGGSVGDVIAFTAFAIIFGSIQTTTLISVNRFFCVAKPGIYRKYFKPKPAILMILGTWIISVLFVATLYFIDGIQFRFNPGNLTYLIKVSDPTTERVCFAFSQFLIIVVPLSITMICYGKVYKAVKENEMNNLSRGQHRHRNTNFLLTKEEIHITKSVLALVCGFIICWIPSSTLWHVSLYTDLPRQAELLITFTAYASSAVNPVLFNIFNKHFRRRFVMVFSLPGSSRVIVLNKTAVNIT